MNSFLDNNTDGGKSFLLYGRLHDWFCPTSLEQFDFDNLLWHLLQNRGYEHIVFYGGAGNRGKHCYDAESARFFFGQDDTVTPSVPPGPGGGAAAPEPDAPQPGDSPSDQMEVQFGSRRRRPSSNARRAQATSEQPAPPQPEQPAAQRMIRYSQVNIANSEFVQEITTLSNKGEKFAVVFYNLFDFLRGGGNTDRRLLDQIVSTLDKPSSNVLCIFEAPSNPDVNQLCHDLQSSPLAVKFLRSVDAQSNQMVLNRYNCFYVGTPGEDEIANLLNRMRIIGLHGRKLQFDASTAKKLAHDLLKHVTDNSGDEPTLLRILLCLERWMDNQPPTMNRIPFSKESIAQLFGCQVREEIPALERLRTCRGWEKVYEMINGVLVLKRHQLAQMERNRDAQPPESQDICVERLAGVRTVRQQAHIPVPNFVLTGNPGTGKTEIGRMIGDILYEEGILPTSKVVMVGKSELTSSLVAGIPRAVMACADRAEGGVLFIDEAPQLADEDGGLNNEGSGPEVVQTLNRIMTDPTRRLCVVLSGYHDGMERLFKIDPGFRSRFGGNEVLIEDYGPDLLGHILRSRLANLDGISFLLSPAVYDESVPAEQQPLQHYLEHLYLKRDRRTFGNARSMVTLAQNLAARALANDRQEILQEDFYGIAPFSDISTDAEPDVVDQTWFEPVNPTDSMEALERDILENTVGLGFLVDRFRLIYERVMEARAMNIPEDKMRQRSFVLVGNPGSGKDLVANLIGRLFRLLNVLNCPEIITHDGGELASHYVGGSIETAREWVKEAQDRNALLFINEAHQLCNEHFDGKGALRAFIAPMTNKQQFVSVFAVYPSEEEAFYELDNGLESRLDKIYLPDYTDKQLYEIFLRMCRKRGFPVDDPRMAPVLELVSRICVRLYRERQPNSGNARQMDILLTEMDDRRVSRCRRQQIPFDDEGRWIYQCEDVPPAWLQRLPDRGCNAETVNDFEEIEKALREDVVGREYLVAKFQALADAALEARRNGKNDFWPRPLFLVGNPGSGKTLIGRLLAKLYNILGVVQSVEPITFDASALSSSYVNGVRRAAEDIVEAARKRHSMIFVDEAHQLLDQHDGVGAIQAFVSPMNDPDLSQRVLSIFAVYEHRLEQFRNSDVGLKRRVEIITLEDYTGPELKQILLHMSRKNGNLISGELDAMLDTVCDGLYRTRTIDSGNAGMMERLLEDMNDSRRARCRRGGIVYEDENYMTLLPEDLPDHYRQHLNVSLEE